MCAVNFNVDLWHAQTINFHERETECSNRNRGYCANSPPLSFSPHQTGWAIAPPNLLKPMHICLNQVYYTHLSLIQEAIAVGLETELARFGQPDSYLEQTVKTLQRKRDETCAVLREVGFAPIVPDGGYFVLADTSAVGKDFDTGPGKEAYDFQFAKWMMVEKVEINYAPYLLQVLNFS